MRAVRARFDSIRVPERRARARVNATRTASAVALVSSGLTSTSSRVRTDIACTTPASMAWKIGLTVPKKTGCLSIPHSHSTVLIPPLPFCDARMLSRFAAVVLAALAACNRASDVPRAALDRFDAPPPVAALPGAARLEVSRDGPASFLPADDASGAAAALAPIPADPLFTNLTIAGFPEAVVSVPNGATSPRPVMIVLHGSGDRPDWNCDAWRHITGARGFVLSLRGQYVPAESTKDDRRYTHRGGAYLRAHVDAALEALAARFAGYVDIERPVVAGFSLGATEVAELAVGAPARFPRVALVEGGHGVWNDVTIRSFAGEDRRVLFGCGSSWCVPSAKAAALRVANGGVQARTVYANVGHTTDRPLQEAIMSELSWFLEGDLRWASAP